MDNPNITLQQIGDKYGLTKVRAGQILKKYFGDDWKKAKKFYECHACGQAFHGWYGNAGKHARYCRECHGEYYKGKPKRTTQRLHCKNCNSFFNSKSDRLYCSRACLVKARLSQGIGN